jgi:hypothetical protein
VLLSLFHVPNPQLPERMTERRLQFLLRYHISVFALSSKDGDLRITASHLRFVAGIFE